MKRCVTCKATLPVQEFNVKRSSSDGRQNVCRSCNRESARRYYAENREAHLAAIRKRAVAARAAGIALVTRYLRAHPCVDCGTSDLRVLDFDHRPGTPKTRNVMVLVRMGFSLSRIAAEIAMCDVRCRNCHAIVTYERIGGTWRDRVLDDDAEA